MHQRLSFSSSVYQPNSLNFICQILHFLTTNQSHPWNQQEISVHYKLDYCNSLYYNLPQSKLKRLQSIQNSLARCVTSSSCFQHITPGLKSLHWLKVEQRIQYKLISLTYSSLQLNSPLYLRRLLTIPTNHRSTRSTSVVTLFKPSVKLETGKRSFSFAAPFLWNSLPKDMRQPSADDSSVCLALTRGPFQKRLKALLFSKSYPP